MTKNKERAFVNYYKRIKLLPHEKLRHYANEKDVNIEIPFRVFISAPSGSFKTNWLRNCIDQMGCFHRFYFFIEHPDEPLYRSWFEDIRRVEKKLHRKMLYISKDPAELGKIIFNPKYNNLVIFDDMITQPKESHRYIDSLFASGRKSHCSLVYISQEFKGISKFLKRQKTQAVLKGAGDVYELQHLVRANGFMSGMNNHDLTRLFGEIVSNPLDALVLDFSSNCKQINRVRKNFTGIDITEKKREWARKDREEPEDIVKFVNN